MRMATRQALIPAIFFFLLYALCMGGQWQGDRLIHLRLAERMVTAHAVSLPPDSGLLRGADGRCYGWHDPGLALCIVPLVAVGNVLTALASSVQYVNMTPLLVRLFSPACGAATLFLFLRLSLAYGVSPRAALAATLILGLAAPLFVSAAEFAAETPQAFLLLLSLSAALSRRAAPLFLSLTLLITLKSYNLIAVALFAVWCFMADDARRLLPVVILAALAGSAVLLAYNQARFGSLFASGYAIQSQRYGTDIGVFSTPLSEGLYGLLFSSGKGLLWFAPPAFIAACGIPFWPRAHRHDLLIVIGIPAVMLLLFAKYWGWHGDYCWGPRLLTPLLPLLLLPLGFLLPRLWHRLPLRIVLLAIVAAGLLVQCLGVLFEPAAYPALFSTKRGIDIRHLRERDPWHELHFVPRYSPLLAHLQLAVALLRGEDIANTAAGPLAVREALAPFFLPSLLSVS